MRVSKNFIIQEFVTPNIYQRWGNSSIWFVDRRVIDIAQYLKDGTLHEMGKCGPGKLKHDYLKEITNDIDSGEIKFPFVIEIQYQSQQEDSGCLEFSQFLRIRDDKKPEECITNFIPETD